MVQGEGRDNGVGAGEGRGHEIAMDERGAPAEPGSCHGQNVVVFIDARHARVPGDTEAALRQGAGADPEVEQAAHLRIDGPRSGVEHLVVVRDEGADLPIVIP